MTLRMLLISTSLALCNMAWAGPGDASHKPMHGGVLVTLKDIDYEISMSDSVRGDMSEFRFDRSVLKYSIYDKKDQALPHTQFGSSVVSFWDKHVKKDKILLNIRCTPETEQFIQPSKIFDYNIVYED
jgi:hypothetical protein